MGAAIVALGNSPVFDYTPAIYPIYDIRTDLRPTVAEIDLDALRANADVIANQLAPGVGMVAVIKADAYGHGAVACAHALQRKVWGFSVSLIEEAVELRRAGIQAPILIFGASDAASYRELVAYRLTPVIGDLAELESLAAWLDQHAAGKPFEVHIKIDTGMSRLGIVWREFASTLDILARHKALRVAGLCTHLADAESPNASFTELQLGRFEECRKLMLASQGAALVCHVSGSAGIFAAPKSHYDLVRPGLALYGVMPKPLASSGVGLRPVLTWRSKIVALRSVQAGDSVSYGRQYVASKATEVATIPVGYADGYSRRLSGRAQVLVSGKRCPVLGTITMDMCMIDVSGMNAKIGDEVILLGPQKGESIHIEELAEWSDSIPWEVFCAISKRVPRMYGGSR